MKKLLVYQLIIFLVISSCIILMVVTYINSLLIFLYLNLLRFLIIRTYYKLLIKCILKGKRINWSEKRLYASIGRMLINHIIFVNYKAKRIIHLIYLLQDVFFNHTNLSIIEILGILKTISQILQKWSSTYLVLLIIIIIKIK